MRRFNPHFRLRSNQTNGVATIASAASNVRWILLSQSVKVLTQLIGVTVLARLLPPRSYGVMALATIVTNLALLFRDMGSSAAIIQAKVLTQTLNATVHWANVALGLSIGVAVAISGPLMSAVFHEPALAKILYLLAFVFPIGSFSIVHQALLERESRFRLVVTAEIIAALAGLIVAVLAALLGAGVYSLVFQVFTSMLISTIGIVLLSDFRPSLNWSRRDFNTIAAFGGNLSVFNFLAYLARNTDSIVIGRVLGATALGIYSIAYRIMLLPVQNLTSVATRALFPIMSRQRDQLSEIAALYLKAVGLIAFLSAPMMAGLFALRELFVDVVLGEKWHSSAALLAWLAPVGVIQSLVSTTGSVSMARGRTDLLLRLGVLGSLLQISGFVIGSTWGVEGVAAGYLCASVLNAVPALHFTGRLIGVTVGMLVRRVAPAMTLALVMAGLLSLAIRSTSISIFDKRVQLVLLTILGAGFYGAMALWLIRAQVLSFRTFFKIPEFKREAFDDGLGVRIALRETEEHRKARN
jgi:O-antigen/teichoic acid export membrane protein